MIHNIIKNMYGVKMKKELIDRNHKMLIESVIRESPKFRGNEELLEIFIEAIYKKSYLLIDAIKDMSRLKRHLQMICDSSMDSVIKEKMKFEETKIYRKIIQNQKEQENVVSIKPQTVLNNQEETLENEFEKTIAKKNIVNLKEEIQRSERYNATDDLIDPLDFCDQKRISADTINKLIDIIKIIDRRFPNKQYYQIFIYRYVKRLKQTEIARELNISQIELSKRFVEMIKLTRDTI